jgi:hypothetical protein
VIFITSVDTRDVDWCDASDRSLAEEAFGLSGMYRDVQSALVTVRVALRSYLVAVKKELATKQDRELFLSTVTLAFECYPAWDSELAKSLQYHITTVRRWSRNKGCPHPSSWPAILQWLIDKT